MIALEPTALYPNSISKSTINMNTNTIRELRAIAKERGFRGYYKLKKAGLVNIVRFLIVVVFHFNQELRLRHIFIYCCFLVSSQREKREIHTTWSLIYVTRTNYI